ncbi:DUF2500 domain-containing protein [Viridibacillus sp. YIM B01967]|uniref:DUF2500 domain-containing protein n=1 Tax=Viridibacillus soli TaxID=2798301 RepID=A0ABS1H569_9BACL|nr:DUF2500 domain-containing protein [Viridibacillus soli]MBK3494563.1 DUF2500 domain-containing protein [Viridibacillus soli]
METVVYEGNSFFSTGGFFGGAGFGGIFISIIFIIVFLGIIFTIVKSISQWSKNNASPILTVPAEVVTKRTKTSGGSGDSAASTRYYTTFEVQSGNLIELPVSGREFGILVEGDIGTLTYQGTRYKGFKRGY